MEANSYEGILSLIPGMYVRVPLDIERTDNNFREYRIGQLYSLDEVANTALVRFHGHVDDEQDEIECPLGYLDRCFILPDTACELAHDDQRGCILYRCSDDFLPGRFAEYYVQIADVTGVVSVRESDLRVQRNRQDYDPQAQLLRYEFQQPVWKFPRDGLIEAYSELHNATFGLEELVSARLILFAHQAEVIARVLADTICRYILADEVGLGKTIEACVILKGLRRRYPRLRVLIIAPTTLVHQWHNEMNSKFWLDLPLVQTDKDVVKASDAPGCILGAEDLATDDAIWVEVRKQQWGLLIVDEAHHVVKQPLLYQRVHHLSSEFARVLILSATPIQRYKQEYLSLLSLVNPERYRRENFADFAHLLEIQQKLLKRIAILTDILQHEFNADDFLDELEPILKLLKDDQELISLSQEIKKQLAVLTGLWSGQPFSYSGQHYQVQEMTFLPPPVQTPRIPIWVIGAWPRMQSIRRALRWDGILPIKMLEDGTFAQMMPADIQGLKALLEDYHLPSPPFDIVLEGETPGGDCARADSIVRPFAQAGVTWWLEDLWTTQETQGGLEGMRRRIQQGPPRVD